MKYSWFTELPIEAFKHYGDRRIKPQGGSSGIPIIGSTIDTISDGAARIGGDVDHALNAAGTDVSNTVNNVGTAIAQNPVLSTGAAIALTAAGVPAPIASGLVAANAGASPDKILTSAAIGSLVPSVGNEVAAATGSQLAGSVAGNAAGQLVATGNINPTGLLVGAAGNAADNAVTDYSGSNAAGNVAGSLASGLLTGKVNTNGLLASGLNGLSQDLTQLNAQKPVQFEPINNPQSQPSGNTMTNEEIDALFSNPENFGGYDISESPENYGGYAFPDNSANYGGYAFPGDTASSGSISMPTTVGGDTSILDQISKAFGGKIPAGVASALKAAGVNIPGVTATNTVDPLALAMGSVSAMTVAKNLGLLDSNQKTSGTQSSNATSNQTGTQNSALNSTGSNTQTSNGSSSLATSGQSTQTQQLNPYAQAAVNSQIGMAQGLRDTQMASGGMNSLMNLGLGNQASVLNNPAYSQGYNSIAGQGQNLASRNVAGNGFQGFGSNPYVDAQATAIVDKASKLYNNTIAPQIGSQAQMAGGYGGSRQGIAEANAMGQLGQDVTNSLASLYGNAYTQDQSFYTNQRNQDMAQAQLGSSLYGAGTAGQLSQGQGLYNLGMTQQNAPWNVLNNASANLNPFVGLGATNVSAQTGNQTANSSNNLYGTTASNQMGMQNSTQNTNTTANSNTNQNTTATGSPFANALGLGTLGAQAYGLFGTKQPTP